MQYKVVYNTGNPEDALLCCTCEGFVWATLISEMLNKLYHESMPETCGENPYKVVAIEV